MSLFLRLLLAHFISDFPLQTKSVFELKVKSFFGQLLHAFIFFVSMLIFCFTYFTDFRFFAFVFSLSLSHMVVDWFKIRITKAKDNLLSFIFDQTIHLILIATVFIFPFGRFFHPFSVLKFLNNDRLILYLITIILASYVCSFLIYYLKTALVDSKIEYVRDWDGMLERFGITSLFILGLFPLSLLVFFSRVVFYLFVASHPKRWIDFVKINEPSLEYQKIKIKGYLVFDLLLSPTLAFIAYIFFVNFEKLL